MHKSIILFFILISSIVSGQKNYRFEKGDLLQQILELRPQLGYSVNQIPKKVKKKYKIKFNMDLNLSDPNKPYNTTDVIYKNEPIGMLLFFGERSRKTGFILFETSGIHSQCQFVFYNYSGKSVANMESVTLERQPTNFEELKQLIRDKKYF